MQSATSQKILSELTSYALGMGARAFGVADLEKLKNEHVELLAGIPGDYSAAVVIGISLQKSVLEGIEKEPTPLYFHNYRQVNYQLDRVALMIADMLQEQGFAALAVPASQIVSRDPMRGHVSHRLLGCAAGLGFIGRSGLLVHPEYGAQMRYVSVLTDAPLQVDEPLSLDCGNCRRCVAKCPAGAISETVDDFDLDACYAKLTEFTRLPFIGQHICGVCVKHCGGARHG